MKKLRVDTPLYDEFMKTATSPQIKDFMAFCAENRVFPCNASLANHLSFIKYSHKIQLCAKRLIHDKNLTEIYFLVKSVIDLRDELQGFGDSEGVDTKTDTVNKINLWISENIDK